MAGPLRYHRARSAIGVSSRLAPTSSACLETARYSSQLARKRSKASGRRPYLNLAWSSADMERRPLSVQADDLRRNKSLKKLVTEHGEAVMGPEFMAEYEGVQADLDRVEEQVVEGRWAAAAVEEGALPRDTHIFDSG